MKYTWTLFYFLSEVCRGRFERSVNEWEVITLIFIRGGKPGGEPNPELAEEVNKWLDEIEGEIENEESEEVNEL